MKVLKRAGIVLVVLIGIMMIYSVLGLNEVKKLNIERIDLMKVPDGTFTGIYDNYRWSNKVKVTVTAHRITEIKPIKIQDGRADLVRNLSQKVLEQQSPAVDVISGATASSKGFLRAVEIALKRGKTDNNSAG
jgi:uncharacterized protein with FMN-binding domain